MISGKCELELDASSDKRICWQYDKVLKNTC